MSMRCLVHLQQYAKNSAADLWFIYKHQMFPFFHFLLRRVVWLSDENIEVKNYFQLSSDLSVNRPEEQKENIDQKKKVKL